MIELYIIMIFIIYIREVLFQVRHDEFIYIYIYICIYITFSFKIFIFSFQDKIIH